MYCSNNVFPFATINDYKLYQTLGQALTSNNDISGSYSPKTCSTLKPCKSLSNLFKEFNNFSSQQNKDTENIINCKYYNIDEIQNLNNLNHKVALSLFHINKCSLPKIMKKLNSWTIKQKLILM